MEYIKRSLRFGRPRYTASGSAVLLCSTFQYSVCLLHFAVPFLKRQVHCSTSPPLASTGWRRSPAPVQLERRHGNRHFGPTLILVVLMLGSMLRTMLLRLRNIRSVKLRDNAEDVYQGRRKVMRLEAATGAQSRNPA